MEIAQVIKEREVDWKIQLLWATNANHETQKVLLCTLKILREAQEVKTL